MLNILLLDDHNLLLDGIASILKNEEDLKVVAKVNTIAATLTAIKKEDIDLIISDYSLENEDCLTLVRKLKVSNPEIKIIVLSMHDEPHLVKEILKEGINGYVLKKDSHHELLSAINAVKKGEIFLSSDINKMLIQNLYTEENKLLTSREREIVKLISKEFTNKQIAEELFISERTVETPPQEHFQKNRNK